MAKWVEYERTRAGDDLIWDGDFHFGDWLAYAAPPGEARAYPGATTGTDLLATAFFAHSTDLLARTARLLGKTDGRRTLRAAVRRASRTRSSASTSRPRGRVGENTQTAYAVGPAVRPAAGGAARRPRPSGWPRTCASAKHLTTGFLGTPYLCHVLSRYGYLDEAYLLLNREDYPSWLYPVKQGATTIWERWDGQKPDGTFQDVGMNSFNHYAYGAIGDWMYRVMAGIEIDEATPGYKHILIQPRPGRRVHRREGQPPDALREGLVRLDAQGRPLRAGGGGPRQHAGHRAASQGAARRRDRRWPGRWPA